VGTFIVDFYCHEAKVAIEIDGGQHAEQSQSVYDEKRTANLCGEGITVLRFWNIDVLRNVEGVLETIAEALSTLTPTLSRGERGPKAANRGTREQDGGGQG
jgi:very-short-patch-repair endonuclease